jgi:PEGA domain
MARQDQSMDSVAASNTPQSAAPEAFGTVAISSDPGGAEIFVDDKSSGNTPAILKPPAGSHAILLKFPGHADCRRTREVLKCSKVSLGASLEPIS